MFSVCLQSCFCLRPAQNSLEAAEEAHKRAEVAEADREDYHVAEMAAIAVDLGHEDFAREAMRRHSLTGGPSRGWGAFGHPWGAMQRLKNGVSRK